MLNQKKFFISFLLIEIKSELIAALRSKHTSPSLCFNAGELSG